MRGVLCSVSRKYLNDSGQLHVQRGADLGVDPGFPNCSLTRHLEMGTLAATLSGPWFLQGSAGYCQVPGFTGLVLATVRSLVLQG